jgi:serine/threonine protein kinase
MDMETASKKKLLNALPGLDYHVIFNDYKLLLDHYHITYQTKGSRIIAGEFGTGPEWLLYISVVKVQFAEALEVLIPFVSDGAISIAVPEDSQVHGMILNGSLGYAQVGKVITVRVHLQEELPGITMALMEAVKPLKGIEIPGTKELEAGILYTAFSLAPFLSGEFQDSECANSALWPFHGISEPKLAKPSKWISKHYLVIHKLKEDPKGSVYKALNLRNWFNIKWCVVKEGRANQCLDDNGRSVTNRLEWQAFLQQEFAHEGFLPKVIDFFNHHKNAYLVMEYIDGVPYNTRVSEIQEGVLYASLPAERKEALLKLMLQLVSIIKKFHDKGYLHRDVSPINFMVRDNEQLIAIDAELAYNVKENIPNPWFTLGTEGYMSPNQAKLKMPEIADDIYGLGGMLIRTLTGLTPIKFDRLISKEQTCNHLNFFINDQRLVVLLMQCRELEGKNRPTVVSIAHPLELSLATLLTRPEQVVQRTFRPPDLNQLLINSINGFSQEPLTGPEGIWYTKEREAEVQSKVYRFSADLFGGAAGIFYALSKCDSADLPTKVPDVIVEANLKKLLENSRQIINAGKVKTGLFSGHAGIGLSLAQLIHDGQLERSVSNLNLIALLTQVNDCKDLSMDSGLSGYGLAAMKIADLIQFPVLEADLWSTANYILKEQRRDGSWFVNDIQKNRKIVAHGLFHGVAGISYFLMVYGYRFEHSESIKAAKKGTSYLISLIRENEKHCHIPPASKSSETDPWHEHGFTGIAYLFIRAFEYNGNAQYQKVAKELLENHPIYITSNYLSQANGIAGVGEVYLEAFRVFKDDIWLERAREIASMLAHSFSCISEDAIYWLDGNDSHPLPGFMNGNAGVLHFLARLNNPQRIEFPFIHFNI